MRDLCRFAVLLSLISLAWFGVGFASDKANDVDYFNLTVEKDAAGVPRPIRLSIKGKYFSPSELRKLLVAPSIERCTLERLENLDELLGEVADCGHITKLVVWQASIGSTGLKHISRMNSLTHMSIYESKLPTVKSESFSGMKSLTVLRVVSSKIHPQHVHDFCDAKTLTDLDLRSCGLPEESFDRLARLRMLDSLDVSANDVTDRVARSIGNLKCIRDVNVVNTLVTAKGVDDLLKCPSLRRLKVSKETVSEDQLAELAKPHPQVRLLRE